MWCSTKKGKEQKSARLLRLPVNRLLRRRNPATWHYRGMGVLKRVALPRMRYGGGGSRNKKSRLERCDFDVLKGGQGAFRCSRTDQGLEMCQGTDLFRFVGRSHVELSIDSKNFRRIAAKKRARAETSIFEFIFSWRFMLSFFGSYSIGLPLD